jgi:alanyl-tRNA synthetase
MTEKIFWIYPYLTELKAKITKIENNKVSLDKTIFYAFSGGQESDEGTIGGIKVVNAIKIGDKENIIEIDYELEREPDFKVGDEVEVIIDKNKRKKIMRLHSAAHIVYYFALERLGALNMIGSNLTSEKSRMDFVYDKPISEFLPQIEKKTNEFIADDHKIERIFDDKNPDLLYWICENWKMPCGGTHVKNTNEIGKVRLKRVNIGKGKERIEIYLI